MQNFDASLAQFPQGCEANWVTPARAQQQANFSAHAQAWLLDPQSLTAKLKHDAVSFRVSLLGQQQAPMLTCEARWLPAAEANTPATVREVLLWRNGQPWVFARSVFPQSALIDSQLQLHQLGDKPLGEHLFKQPDLTRSEIEVAEFPAASSLGKLNEQLTGTLQPLWGRRSCFAAAGQQVLVAEIFLSPASIYEQPLWQVSK